MKSALKATSESLAKYLEACLKADVDLKPFFQGGTMVVSLNTPQEMTTGAATMEGVSVWLYRVVRDETRLNDPPARLDRNHLLPPPLPLRLHYLVTPITAAKKPNSPGTEQLILGKVLQCLYTHPILRGVDMAGTDFEGTGAELHVRLEPLTLDEIARVWEALDASYQLSVSYEVSLVNIQPEAEPERVVPVDVALPEYGLSV